LPYLFHHPVQKNKQVCRKGICLGTLMKWWCDTCSFESNRRNYDHLTVFPVDPPRLTTCLSTLSPEYEKKFRDGILLPECQAKTAKNMYHCHHRFILWQVAASEIKAVSSFLFLYIFGMFYLLVSIDRAVFHLHCRQHGVSLGN